MAPPPLRSSPAAPCTALLRSSRGVVIPGSMMVRLPGEDLVRAEELLDQHDAGELVRERHRTEREPLVAPVELDPVRAAEHEAHVAPRPAPLLQPARERDGVARAAARVEQHPVRPRG